MKHSRPQLLRAGAMPYIPLVRYVRSSPVALPPSPGFFPPAVAYTYQAPHPAPPPQAGFLGGVQGCWGIPLHPGGVGMQGAFPHPPWAPLMPAQHGAFAIPAGTPCFTATVMPQGGGKQPSPGSKRTGRAHGPRPRPSVDVPPRVQPAAASRGAKAAGDGGDGAAKEEPANEPSPRSVLVTSSPPISPTSSLPSSFPLPCLPPATAAPAPPMEPPHISAELDTATPLVSPQKRRRQWQRGPRRAQPASGGEGRRSAPKPRRLFDPESKHTSVMIRNIPNDFTRERLMSIIDQHCFIENEEIATGGVRSQYDFLYVPIDFRTLANKGYAFVNMTSPDGARRLWEHFHGRRWRCGKTCAVDDGAVQGLAKLVDHFSRSSFTCDTEDLLPVRFEPPRDGTRPAKGVMHVVGRLAHRS